MTVDWSKVSVGDTVMLRGKRTADRRQVTVVEVLPRVLPDGPGIVGDDGQTYRRYYYDIDLRPVTEDGELRQARRLAARPSPSNPSVDPERLNRFEKVVATLLAGGFALPDIEQTTGLTTGELRSLIVGLRRRYEAAGIPTRSTAVLRSRLVRDGYRNQPNLPET